MSSESTESESTDMEADANANEVMKPLLLLNLKFICVISIFDLVGELILFIEVWPCQPKGIVRGHASRDAIRNGASHNLPMQHKSLLYRRRCIS